MSVGSEATLSPHTAQVFGTKGLWQDEADEAGHFSSLDPLSARVEKVLRLTPDFRSALSKAYLAAKTARRGAQRVPEPLRGVLSAIWSVIGDSGTMSRFTSVLREEIHSAKRHEAEGFMSVCSLLNRAGAGVSGAAIGDDPEMAGPASPASAVVGELESVTLLFDKQSLVHWSCLSQLSRTQAP